MSLNSIELIKKEKNENGVATTTQNEWLSREAKDLILKIKYIKPATIKSTHPAAKIVFEIQNKNMAEKVVSDLFFLTEKAEWRIRILASRCGVYEWRETPEQGRYKHILFDLVSRTANELTPLIGKIFIADYVQSGAFLALDNFRVFETDVADIMNNALPVETNMDAIMPF